MSKSFLVNYLLLLNFIFLSACSPQKLVSEISSIDNGASISDPKDFKAFFPKNSIWSTDISRASLDYQSQDTIAWMASHGNWGGGHLGWWPHNYLRISTEWRVLRMTASTPFVPFDKRNDYYSPACDDLTSFPVPPLGGIQGSIGYDDCFTKTGGDCHMVVYDEARKKLYESYTTDYINGRIVSTCGVVWDTSKVYPVDGRGDQCTSTDAAGLPASALIFSADDLAAGRIDHALRLTLPNTMIRANMFVHPATHASTAPNAPSPAPIYGARLRLKSNFDISKFSSAMQVILKAMQTYGMILSDGGDIAISAANDADTVHKYSEFNLNVDHALSSLTVDNFEVIDGGPRIPLTFNCVRNGQ